MEIIDRASKRSKGKIIGLNLEEKLWVVIIGHCLYRSLRSLSNGHNLINVLNNLINVLNMLE